MTNPFSSGQLSKMKVIAFKKQERRATDKVGEFVVMFNPTTYSRRYALEFQSRTPPSPAIGPQVANRPSPEEMNFEFLVDGTGAAASSAAPVSLVGNPSAPEVKDLIQRFLDLCYFNNSSTHRPNFLRLSWSNLVFDCVLKASDVEYTLFRPDGSPLRAKIKATFIEDTWATEGRQEVARLQTADLTRERSIETGDRLDAISQSYYDSPEYFVQLGRFNGLHSLRTLRTGKSLRIPPLKDQDA